MFEKLHAKKWVYKTCVRHWSNQSFQEITPHVLNILKWRISASKDHFQFEQHLQRASVLRYEKFLLRPLFKPVRMPSTEYGCYQLGSKLSMSTCNHVYLLVYVEVIDWQAMMQRRMQKWYLVLYTFACLKFAVSRSFKSSRFEVWIIFRRHHVFERDI